MKQIASWSKAFRIRGVVSSLSSFRYRSKHLIGTASSLLLTRPPLPHLSSELPQSPQLSQPLIQFTIHTRPLRNARRCFLHHKQYKWWEQVVLNGICAQ
jgi:hypothetical protein